MPDLLATRAEALTYLDEVEGIQERATDYLAGVLGEGRQVGPAEAFALSIAHGHVPALIAALKGVLTLHVPRGGVCASCGSDYPCGTVTVVHLELTTEDDG